MLYVWESWMLQTEGKPRARLVQTTRAIVYAIQHIYIHSLEASMMFILVYSKKYHPKCNAKHLLALALLLVAAKTSSIPEDPISVETHL